MAHIIQVFSEASCTKCAHEYHNTRLQLQIINRPSPAPSSLLTLLPSVIDSHCSLPQAPTTPPRNCHLLDVFKDVAREGRWRGTVPGCWMSRSTPCITTRRRNETALASGPPTMYTPPLETASHPPSQVRRGSEVAVPRPTRNRVTD